ncbi:SRPBCC family protein [Larkinella soli]|uniref:SRPBCC family protein n=1 Tax=Larkinella soli TaxID=1770527 RepID=UPI000FFBCBDA|nr:SRPBCC domain-containing protein [Larkinella soli]
MIRPLSFDFSVDRPGKTIVVLREFSAERPFVWAAFTRPELLDQWWAPQPWKTRTKTMDFREGGQWFYAMNGPEGEENWNLLQYTSIRPQEHFAAHSSFTDAEGRVSPEMPQSGWTLTFKERGPVTEVEIRISFEDVAQLETILKMGFQEGFTQTLAALDQQLAGGGQDRMEGSRER